MSDAPVPLPTPWPRVLGQPGRLRTNFQQGLADWKDVRLDGHDYTWLLPGIWRVTSEGLRHDEIRRPPAVSFRRYSGKAFGTADGELPARYRFSVTVTPLDAHPSHFPPVGDLGVPIYYLTPVHYVEAVFKPESFEIWACDGGLPEKWRGWHPLYQTELRTQARQARRLEATVDSTAGTLSVSVDGKVMASVRHALIQPISHWGALRATGNQVNFSELRIESE